MKKKATPARKRTTTTRSSGSKKALTGRTAPAKKKATQPAAKNALSAPVKKASTVPANKSVFSALMSTPFWNIRDAGDCYKVRISVPGIDIKNVKINVDGNRLTVSCAQENKAKKSGKQYMLREYSYSTWSKSIALPQRVDSQDMDVRYKDGILKVDLPKA